MTPRAIPSQRIGLLFDYEFDRPSLARQQHIVFDRAGFDLFSFPSQLALATFDIDRFVHRQIARGRRRAWQGVHSAHEQYGALAAAMIAQGLGLPGPTPQAIVAAQHKAHTRQVLQAIAPESNLAFQVLPLPSGRLPDASMLRALSYPLYIKPVKAAFSILARRVESWEELQQHLRFSAWERYLMRRLIDPFERVSQRLLPHAGSAHRMLIETPVDAGVPQYNLDGYVQDGQAHAIGVVDALMYPGTQAFMRWDVPSRLPAPVQARALALAGRLLKAIGFDQGLFNLEFFHDSKTDRLTVIECNPRMASQFSDLYRRTLGLDLHALALRLALGQRGQDTPRIRPSAAVASSIVYRSFAGERTPPAPDVSRRQALMQTFPDALLFPMPKSQTGRLRDLKWTGSHRYGVLHLGADSPDELRQRAAQASHLLGWTARVAET